MSWFQFILAYLLSWWLVLFMVLPLWVRTPAQPGQGHAPSAPERAYLGRKFLLTTLLAFLPALLLLGITNARAASGNAGSNTQDAPVSAKKGTYHAGSGKCPAKTNYAPPADLEAKEGVDAHGKKLTPATMNPDPLADEVNDVKIPLEIPIAPYLKREQQDSNGPSPYNADLSQGFGQMGTIEVKKNGESTLNGHPIGGADTDCDNKDDNKKK